MKLSKSITLISDLQNYQKSWLRHDVIAGLTVAIMLIPQGIAYGLLAGLPAIYGLYAAFVPLLIYPLFGSSKQLSVGPVALVSIMILTGLSQHADPGTPEFIQLAILTALVAGLIQLLLAIFRMGFLISFLSEPVIAGFMAAAAIIIALSQFKNILGIDIERSGNVMQLIKNISLNITSLHLATFLLGLGGLLLILSLRKIKKSIPGALLAVVLGIIIVYSFSLSSYGVQILADIPRGLPTFSLSFFQMENILVVFPLALAICFISFIESLAIAKTISAKHDNYPIRANRELLGLGLSKVVGAFFQAFPSTGSFTRSAINHENGARTGLASFFAAFFIGLVLVFFTSSFYYLPKAILGAIIIAAVIGLINIKYARNLFHLDRKDFYVYLATFFLTLILGVLPGVFSGIILSILMIIYKSSKPHYAILGKLEGADAYRNIKRFSEARVNEEILIIRYDDDIFFGNADHFYDTIIEEIDLRPKTKLLILNAAAISRIDSTGLQKLNLFLDTLDKKQVRLILTNLRGPVRDLLAKSGLDIKIGLENYYLNIKDAMNGYQKSSEAEELSRRYAAQKNNLK